MGETSAAGSMMWEVKIENLGKGFRTPGRHPFMRIYCTFLVEEVRSCHAHHTSFGKKK